MSQAVDGPQGPRGSRKRWIGHASASGHDLDDFEAVAGVDEAGREFGGGNRLTVMLDDDAAGAEALMEEELFEGAGEGALEGGAVGDDVGRVQED